MIANTDNKDKPLARLLVVDDDPDTILALKIGLLDYGFLVDGFTNPQEALQSFKASAESYCLVLLDIKMPALSGTQLAKKVKEVNPNVKVLLLTALGIRDNEVSDVSSSTNVDGFIQKPVGNKELTDKILSLIGENKAI
ncbi:MAG: response regulator [Nitrososphaeraceae archaeon]|nr:response regulator [Nitrososphaeraceae archaeon]